MLNKHHKKNGQANELADSEPLICATEVGSKLNLNPRTIALHAAKGTIPCYKIGKTLRFRMSEVWEVARKGSPR